MAGGRGSVQAGDLPGPGANGLLTLLIICVLVTVTFLGVRETPDWMAEEPRFSQVIPRVAHRI
jgi:hypothetical protein